MRLAFFGDGRMGSAALVQAQAEGNEIGLVVNSDDGGQDAGVLAQRLRGHDAALDFSVPHAVLKHVTACATARVPLIEGTTGWQDQEAEAKRVMAAAAGTMVIGANFSIGVQVFYRLVDRAGELFGGLGAYDAFIEEAHHATKRDAPSGTARELDRLLERRLGRKVSVASTRAGHIPGVHRVGFDSAADQVTLIHMARSRAGFAVGALAAARWVAARPKGTGGVFSFADVLDQILAAERSGKR